MSNKHLKIPPELMQKYLNWEISSTQLAKETGYHPVYLRRSIKRENRPKAQVSEKTRLIQARENLRKSVAHLKVSEIAKTVSVSLSTAARIKRKYRQDNV